MRKAVILYSLLFAFTTFSLLVAAYGQQVDLESGLVATYRIFPIASGQNADELAQYSISSAFKDLSLDRFLQYCGTTRITARLRTALSILNPNQLCAGTDEFSNVCSTTNCDAFRDSSTTCSLSDSQLEGQCVERLTNERETLFGDLALLETSIASRCNNFKENYQGGDVRIGPVDSTVARQACVSHGFQYSALNGVGQCGVRSTGGGNINIDNGNPDITINGGGGGSGGGSNGDSGGGSSGGGGGSGNGGGDQSGMDDGSNGAGNGGTPGSGSGAAAVVNYTCTDTETRANVTIPGTVTINDSNGQITSYADTCIGSKNNFVIEYSCRKSNSSAPTNQTLACPNGTNCSGSPGACINPNAPPAGNGGSSPVSYNCTDSDGNNSLVSGTVTITASNGTVTTRVDTCGNTLKVVEYTCSSLTASNATASTINCLNGANCTGGRCVGGSGGTPPKVTYTCTDSDHGNNVTVTGTVIVTASNGTTMSNSIDFCSAPKVVTEYNCSSPTASTPTSTLITCASGLNCSSGRCSSGIAAAPSSPSGLVIGAGSSGTSSDSSIALLSQEEVQTRCVSQLRAKVFESYATESIRSTCRREVTATTELRSVFCRRPENAYNECRTYLEDRCQYAGPASQKCRAITTSQDDLLSLLTDTMNAKCESRDATQSLQFSDLSTSLPFSAAFIVNGQEDKLTKAIATTRSATKPRDPIYEFVLKPFCMKYVEEKQGARDCNTGVGKINEVVEFLNSSKTSLPQQSKEQVNTLIQSVKTTSDGFAEQCIQKDKNAGGLCTTIFGK